MAITPYSTEREDPSFTSGELALHPQADIEQGLPLSRWYLSRWMEFDGGVYTIKAVVDDAATWWIGRRANEANMVMAHVLAHGVVTKEVHIHAGVQRIDIIVENITTGPSPTYIQFSIWQGERLIYASSPDDWLVDYVAIPDEELVSLGDRRRSLPVFSVLPNWKNGVTERLSWYTDVMQSESGAEQRRAVRAHPRRTFEASFARFGRQRALLDNFFVAVGQNEFMLPLWHEAVRMMQGITPGASGVSFDPDIPMASREFRRGDLVFVNNGNPQVYDILEVGEVFTSRFDWRESPKKAWPPGTRIYPMRRARLIDPPQISNVTDKTARVQVRFDLVEPDPRTPSWGNEFDNTGFFNFIPNRVEPIQMNYSRVTFTLDNESSAPLITDPGRETQIDMGATFMFRGRNEVTRFRNFLAAARGQAVGFYMMTYTDDIEIAEPISHENDWIAVEDSSYSSYMDHPQPVRLLIGLWTYQHGWLIRAITGVEPGRFYINEPFPTLERHEIRRVCFVTPARFAQDSIELQHVTAESSVITTRLLFRHLFNKRLMLPA